MITGDEDTSDAARQSSIDDDVVDASGSTPNARLPEQPASSGNSNNSNSSKQVTTNHFAVRRTLLGAIFSSLNRTAARKADLKRKSTAGLVAVDNNSSSTDTDNTRQQQQQLRAHQPVYRVARALTADPALSQCTFSR